VFNPRVAISSFNEEAARFAAKEAAIKALGIRGMRLAEIEPFVHMFLDQEDPDPNWLPVRGFIACVLGRTDEGRREFERIVVEDGLRSLPRNFVWLAHLALLSESAAMLGHAEGAGVLYRLMLPFADRNVLSADLQCWGAAARYLGILATTCGRLDDAERWLRRALAMNRRMGASPWVGHTLADLAAALLRRGRPDDLAAAQAHLDDALAIGRALEMPRLIERLQRRNRAPRSPAISSRIRSGVTLSWLAKLTCATGAKSQTPRHSSSCSVMSSSSDSSDSFFPRSTAARTRLALHVPHTHFPTQRS
jgi:tetratricopeptide (TPR) repeat protein